MDTIQAAMFMIINLWENTKSNALKNVWFNLFQLLEQEKLEVQSLSILVFTVITDVWMMELIWYTVNGFISAASTPKFRKGRSVGYCKNCNDN